MKRVLAIAAVVLAGPALVALVVFLCWLVTQHVEMFW